MKFEVREGGEVRIQAHSGHEHLTSRNDVSYEADGTWSYDASLWTCLNPEAVQGIVRPRQPQPPAEGTS